MVGEYLEIINDQDLYDFVVREKNETDEFANFVLENIKKWNFITESFEAFVDELKEEYEGDE